MRDPRRSPLRVPLSPPGRRFLAAAAIAAAALAPARPAAAQFGLPGVPQVVHDPSNLAKNAAQLTQQIAAVNAARQQLTYQLQALRKLPNPPLREINSTMAQLRGVMAAGDALVYAATNVEQQFRTTFPLSRPFTDYAAESNAQASRTLATMRAALGASGAQAQTFAAGQDRLTALQAAVRGVQGHQGALELIGATSIYQGQELLLLRQAIAAQTNVHAVRAAYEVNRQVQQEVTARETFRRMATPPARRPPFALVTP